MHGEQEAKLILEDGFTYDHVQDEEWEWLNSQAQWQLRSHDKFMFSLQL